MIKKVLPFTALAVLVLAACNKNDNNTPATDDFPALETTVLTSFTNNVALPAYAKLSTDAATLNTSLQALVTAPTEDNLTAARNNWKSMRQTWEQAEGFLFGPVEDNDYDPNMDTWPTDYVQMDSLLASNNDLEVADIQNFTLSLRGYHPIEYIIFGDHGSRKAADITERQKKYISSLSTDLKTTCADLYASWSAAPTNFAQEVIKAGAGSTKYAKKQDAFLAIVGGLADICGEVGEGKMKEPFDEKKGSLVESPYSGNSLIDFKNNIIGAQNVYIGLSGGQGLSALVAAKNKSLDNKIKGLFTTAINSFDNITVPYEEAIDSQRVQCQQTMDALVTLKEALEGDLSGFITTYVKD